MPKSDCGVQLGLSSLSHTHTSLPFSHSCGVSLCFALSLSLSRCVPSLLFHSPLLSSSHSWSVSALENYCAHTDSVIAGGMKRTPAAWLQTRHALRVPGFHPRCRTSPLSSEDWAKLWNFTTYTKWLYFVRLKMKMYLGSLTPMPCFNTRSVFWNIFCSLCILSTRGNALN